ncbi:hypothetical protein HOY34_11335 [Xinfangfangia sp. D13-10-4-6]|uniref:hypothetical protein n=1 Tax=Pseudogemmobacter hezensis TaxID=2737662 RepID=UPI001554D255|nr:hypothetical protein [Pseudogemmobacter hezensis]NPD15794.1 hypothetical protein [Pseudogemmobacter hezensis]
MAFERTRYAAFFGQSYGREGFQVGGAWAAFIESIRRLIAADPALVHSRISGPTITSTETFENLNCAWDGSAVLQKHTGAADNYWLENDGTTAGPRLTAALAAMAGAGVGYGALCYSHGEQDAAFTTTATLANEARAGMEAIRQAARTAINPGNPNGIPWFVDLLGPRFTLHEMNEYRLRDAMLDMIGGDTRTFRGAEKYAANLDATTHPAEDFSGYARLGAWAGRKMAKFYTDLGELRGPQIGAVIRSGSAVTVPITTPGDVALVRPDRPDFFGLWDASGTRLPITGFGWTGNTLTITAGGTPATMRYPARSDRPHDITNIIRLNNPADPVFPGEPGLPLESVRTISL